jgi:hypothetical protein
MEMGSCSGGRDKASLSEVISRRGLETASFD